MTAPAEAFVFGRGGAPDKPFKWTYHLWWGFAELTTVCADAFGQIPTNKVIGGVWPNNTDGNAFRDAFTARFTAPDSGFTLFDAGAYNEPNEDFTAIIGSLKKTGCEILTCCQIPPDFNTFWSQCKQQGLNPKIMDGSKATLFPEAVESYGELSLNLISGIWWHPTFPYKSSLSGETCQQIADGFEKETGKQWTSPLAHYIVFEAAANALQRAKDLDDKESIIQAVSTIKVDTIVRPHGLHRSRQAGDKTSFRERGHHAPVLWTVGERHEVAVGHSDHQQRQRGARCAGPGQDTAAACLEPDFLHSRPVTSLGGNGAALRGGPIASPWSGAQARIYFWNRSGHLSSTRLRSSGALFKVLGYLSFQPKGLHAMNIAVEIV